MYDPFQLITILMLMSLAPFIVIMVTSFTKLVVVFQLIRSAMGLQQTPPTMVLNGISLVLSLYIMFPVGQKIYMSLEDNQLQKAGAVEIIQMLNIAKEPVRVFLQKHAKASECNFFAKSVSRIWPEEERQYQSDDIIVLLPAFLVSELTRAFQIGFVLYLPFIAVDIIVSNILMSMGMHMVSPTTISLPFKLLLFVFLNGWSKIVHGLILTYA